jgi:micrococcal nuclease
MKKCIRLILFSAMLLLMTLACGENTAQTPLSSTSACDPSYPTVCLPSPPPDLDCDQVSFSWFTVLSPDPHRFDADKDGIGCETGLNTSRDRHSRALSRAFYETIYAQPWGGRAEFSSILPTMLSETKTLFFMAEAIPGGIDGLTAKFGKSPESVSGNAKSPVGETYKAFLNDYLQNPDKYRNGEWLRSKVAILNDLLEKAYGPKRYPLDTWSDADQKNWLWVQPLFSDVDNGRSRDMANINRLNLMKMIATGGRQGYFYDAIESGVANTITHYRNMGYSEQEIFSLMTRLFRK